MIAAIMRTACALMSSILRMLWGSVALSISGVCSVPEVSIYSACDTGQSGCLVLLVISREVICASAGCMQVALQLL